MREPTWINPAAVLRFHSDSLMAFGGSPGIRDAGAIDSALARARNLFVYGQADLFDLAAAYTAGLCQNHGFVDGNKRTAFLTGFTFLYENGYLIDAEQAEVVAAMLSLADHTLDEPGYAAWLREHIIRLSMGDEHVSATGEKKSDLIELPPSAQESAVVSPPPDTAPEAINLIRKLCGRPDEADLEKADEMAGGREKLLECLRFMVERNMGFETGELLLCSIYDQCQTPDSKFASWLRSSQSRKGQQP